MVGSGYAIFQAFAMVFIVFYGERAFKPTWMGIGQILAGVSCILFALAHFTAPTYDPQAEEMIDSRICLTNGTNEEVCESSSLRYYW